jgi:sulfite exporter TauE/SafE
MFVLGLATSLHCVGMCGGLVLTYAVKGTEDGPWYRRLLPHLAYQGSKILSYATIALILGGLAALASVAVDENTTRPILNWVQLVAGVYMILLGVSMTGKVKFLRHITPRPPEFLVRALTRNRKKAVSDAKEGQTSLATPITFGLLTGLMPCAPLIGAQVQAVAQGSVLSSVAGMAAFGIGTMPLTLAFGLTSDLLSHRFRKSLNMVAVIAVIVFGLIFINRGLVAVGSPVTFGTVTTAAFNTSGETAYTRGADGVIEIPLAIVNTQYVPKDVHVPADTPFRLVVDRQEAVTCSDELWIEAAGVHAPLTPNGITKIDLPAMKAGVYQMTCQMNMMEGTLVVGGGTPWVLPSLLAALALVLIAVGVALPMLQKRRTATARGSAAGGSAVRILGFTPADMSLAAGVVLLFVVIGLWSGGLFH